MRKSQLIIPLTGRQTVIRTGPVALPTNATTQAIIKFLQFRGMYAVRINVQGMYDPVRKVFRKSHTQRGTADIHACVHGHHVSIEIKTGTDRQTDYQKITQEQVQHSGGIYLIIKSFPEFHDWYHNFKTSLNNQTKCTSQK